MFRTLAVFALALVRLPAETVSFAPVPASVTIPAGWKLAGQQESNAVLTPAVNPQSILLVHTGVYQTLEHLATALGAVQKELNVDAHLAAPPEEGRFGGRQGYSVRLKATAPDGTPVGIYCRAVLSADGIGILAMGMAAETAIGELQKLADVLIRGAVLGRIPFDPRAAAAWTGQWNKAYSQTSGNQASASGGWADNSTASYVFHADGRYEYRSRSTASISAGTASVSSDQKDEDSGHYYPVGGKIILTSAKKGSRTLDARLSGQILQIGETRFLRAAAE